MLALFGTVLAMSLFGSMHCAGMCGAFVMLCVGGEKQSAGRHAAVQSAYHGGRLIVYTMLGVLAGTIGSFVDLGGKAIGLQRTAMMAAGIAMIIFGLIALLRVLGVRIATVGVPRPMRDAFLWGQQKAHAQHPVLRALIIGLFSMFLPCGWLYAYVVVAAGTADPLYGGLTMIAFWMGTVPILAALGVGVQTLLGPLRKHLPAAMAVILVVVGVGVTVRGFEVRANAAEHGPAARPASLSESIEQAEAVDQETLPCCAGDEEAAEEPPVEDADQPSALESAIEQAKSVDQSALPCCAGDDEPAEGGEADPATEESSQ